MSSDRYPDGSDLNREWRYCPKCGAKLSIDDTKQPLDAPRQCPQCKTTMVDRKPMTDILETKLERLRWTKL
jgi:Zn-finger nucleic acid-binding protein